MDKCRKQPDIDTKASVKDGKGDRLDLIRRQDAIDAMYKIVERNLDLSAFEDGLAENLHIDVIVDELENLPSAEPEITFCKNCVKRNNMGFCTILQNNIHGIATSWYKPEDDDFCSRAERRTDE